MRVFLIKSHLEVSQLRIQILLLAIDIFCILLEPLVTAPEFVLLVAYLQQRLITEFGCGGSLPSIFVEHVFDDIHQIFTLRNGQALVIPVLYFDCQCILVLGFEWRSQVSKFLNKATGRPNITFFVLLFFSNNFW